MNTPTCEALGQDLGGPAATEQHHALRNRSHEAQQFADQLACLPLGDDPNMVAGLEAVVATRDDRLVAPADRRDHEVPVGFELLGDVAERPPDEGRFGRQAGTDHQYLAADHVSDLVGPREVEQLEDLLGGLGVGVDEEVGA